MRERGGASTCKESPPKVVENRSENNDEQLPVAPSQLTTTVRELVGELETRELRYYYALRRHEHLLEAPRPRAARISSWSLGALPEDRALYVAFAREHLRLARSLRLTKEAGVIPVKPLLPDELAKWELITHGRHAFNVIAGSFEIEHFHGQTNIRVLDPLRVTLESEVRGVKPAAASSEMGAPIYQ